MDPSYSKGLESQEEEVEDLELEVEGSIPDWLNGSLIRKGPALFKKNGSEAGHWFDGLAMLNKYRFRNGSVFFSKSFLRSDAYEEVMENGFESAGFAASPSGYLDKFRGLLGAPPGNSNVNVERIAGDHVALTETPGCRH